MKTLSTSLAIALVAMLFAQAANADWKGYAGLTCLASNPSNDIRRSLSGAANWDESARIVYCPVVRDIAEGGPDRIKRINIRLFDNSFSEDGWCRAVSRSVNGTTHNWQHQPFSGHGEKTVTFENINTPNWGHVGLYCKLPGTDGARKSFVRSYGVEEQ